jgi:NTE family protein
LKQKEKTVTAEELKKNYFRFVDEGFVKTIYPGVKYNHETGYYDLFLNIQKEPNFNFQFGGNISLGTSNEGFLQVKYKYLWKHAVQFVANGYFGRFYNSAKVGGRIDISTKFPWFLETYYTYNSYNFFRNSTYFFDDVTPSYMIQWESFICLNTGIPVTSKGKLVPGFEYALTASDYYQTNEFSRGDTADKTEFNFISPSICLDFNSLNRKQYPDEGTQWKITLSYLNGKETLIPGSHSVDKSVQEKYRDWFILRVIYDDYFHAFGPIQLGVYAEGTFSTQPLFLNYTSSMLYAPVFQPLPEMQSLFMPSFRALNYGALGMKSIFTIYKRIAFRAEGYVFQPFQEILENPEDHSAYLGPILSDRSFILSGLFVYNSIVGPISIGMSYYDRLLTPFVFNLNFGYILFNRRALP